MLIENKTTVTIYVENESKSRCRGIDFLPIEPGESAWSEEGWVSHIFSEIGCCVIENDQRVADEEAVMNFGRLVARRGIRKSGMDTINVSEERIKN